MEEMMNADDSEVVCSHENCGKTATYDSPRDLCDEHWADWWVEGLFDEGTTPDPALVLQLKQEVMDSIRQMHQDHPGHKITVRTKL